MKQVFGAIGIFLGVLILLIGLNFVFGWTDVYFTKTVGKAQQNAQRTVFEETQSYVEGKRQEVTKLRFEYMKAKDKDEKEAIKATLRSSLANFDKSKLDYDLQAFVDTVVNRP